MSFTEGGKENFVKINDFLAQLKTIVDEMSEQELRVWLYDYARRLSEEAREPFLQELLELEVEEAFVQEEIDQKMLWASDWLDEVEEGKKIIYYIQDDDINDWDYDYEPGDEYEGIEDPDNVLKEFTQVLEIIDYIVMRVSLRMQRNYLDGYFKCKCVLRLFGNMMVRKLTKTLYISLIFLMRWLLT